MAEQEHRAARIRALIMDRRHRCLVLQRAGAPLDSWELPAAEVWWTDRPLQAFKADVSRSLGLDLRGPAGSCVLPDGVSPRDFAFLFADPPELRVDPAAVAATRWVPVGQLDAVLASGDREAAWRIYVEAVLGSYEPPRRDLDAFHFGNTPELAAKLAHLVVKGQKRATSGWIEAMERQGEAIPEPGKIWVVTDGFGYPQCIIETMEVRRVPFGEVAEDIARGEGEGDLTYADWREVHLRYFSAEAAELGLSFGDESLVLNEVFRVIRVLGTADPAG
jgi:uncharacterized protein YhfF